MTLTEEQVQGHPFGQHPSAPRCMLCGGSEHQIVFHEFGTDILRCRHCHHVFSSFPAEAHYAGYWDAQLAEPDVFYWNVAHARMYQDFARKFLERRSGKLLDVGCGLGFFLKAIEPFRNWEAHGCEISPAAVRYARETLGLTRVACGRLEDAGFQPGTFDIITMWDVIEHILEPDALLRHCHALLSEGGICFMHTPNINVQLPKARLKRLLRGMRPNVGYLQARDHLHHYSTGSLRRLLERNGFSRVEFVHMHPIQSVSGSRSPLLRGVKNTWFGAARALFTVSRGRLNLDNLFVAARK